MPKTWIVAAGVAVLIAAGGFLYRWNVFTPQSEQEGRLIGASPQAQNSAATPNVVPASEVPYRAEVVATNLTIPWSIAFTTPTRILVTERPGQIRVIDQGQLRPEPLLTFPEVSSNSEEGLMGLALDFEYPRSNAFYVCLSYPADGRLLDKVVRLIDEDTTARVDRVIIDGIPANRNHAGCELGFGPDGKLYISTGDAQSPQLAQNQASLAGKMLRINGDGSIPDDNPFPGSPVWSLGHRNSQGFDWHPGSDTLWATEHGPSGNDGPLGGDEINVIKRSQNYGWPEVHHEETRAPFIDPKLVFTPAVAPASGAFYQGQLFPEFAGDFFFAALRGEGLFRIVVSPDNPEQIVLHERLPGIEFGRIREVKMGPDGALYFTTSNRDGRGRVREGDDKLYRLVRR